MAKGISFEEALRPPEPAKPTGGFSFEEVMRPAAPAASAPVARKQEAPPAAVETAAGVLPTEATDLRDVFGRDLLSRPGREATFLGELGRGAKGAVEYGFPIMGRQLALQGSASAMAERQNQTALMDQIDQGQFKTLTDLKNSPQYQALREGGGNVGTLNAYFANRGQPEVGAKLRGGVEREMTKLAGDTAGHIKTLNQYAQENKAKYGPRVEKFTDINWTDPAVVADFKDWLGYNMGSGAVQMAPIMLAAALTKQPGLLAVSGGMGVSEAVGNRLKFVQDQVKSLPPEQQGQAIAKYIAESGDTNLVTGLVSGSFDLLLGPAAKLAKGALPKELGRMATVKQAVKELPKDIRGEAVTGALQQATQIAAAKKLQEEGRAVTWQNIKDVIDSAAAEAAGAPAGTAVNVGMAALQAPSDPASQLARAIEEDAQQAGATPEALRMRSALESAQAPPQARGFTFEEVTAPAADAVPPAAPVVTPAPVAAPVATGVEAIPGMPTGEELETPEAPAPVDLTGWTESPNTINAKTGEPIFPAGVRRFTKEDDTGARTIILRDGQISQSRTMSKPIRLENSILDFDAPVTGRIEISHHLGHLNFYPDDGKPVRMSPRAEQMYKAGESLDKIAELEFSDAGGIRPDGTRTPHTTIGAFVGAQPTSAPAAPVTPVTKPAPAAVQQKVPSFESSLAPGFVRVYHSGSKGDGKGARWASTDRTYASNYRADLPLFYTDIPANDPRVNNPDYPDQGVAQGFTFNFELSPQEAVQLKEVPRTAKAAAPAPAPAPAPAAPAKPRTTMQDVIQEMTDAELQDARTNVMFSLPAVDAEIAKRRDRAADEAAARGQADIFGAPTEAAPVAKAQKAKKKPATFGPSDEIAPRVDSVEAFLRGTKGFTPVVIAEDAPLYTETNAEGLKRILAADRQFEEGGFYVSDNPDLAIGQGENKGINVEFRPNSLSGSENVKPMTGLAGREYITNIRAPRAVAKVTLANKKAFDALDFATKTALRDEFAMQRQADGKLVFTRRPEFGGIAAPTAKAQEAQAEPGSTPDENDPGFRGASDEEVAEVASAFEGAKDNQEDEANTRVFDAPAKSEIVRIEQKAARSGVLTIAQAKKKLAEWKRNAQAQGETGANSDKIVLSLFDATGEWSKPWEEAGYQVFRFDIQTDPEMGDVNKFSVEFFNDLYGAFDGQDVYAILAACPCTDFAVSGARHFAAKDESGKTVESVELVYQTLRTVEFFKPSIWAIENPVGRIEKLTGLPPWRMSFNPNHFGDPYTKKTLLWGRFNADLPVAPVAPTEGSKMHRMYGGKSQDTKNARSVTPEGFAYSFFQANNAVDNPVMAVANKYDMLKPAVIKQALDAGLTSQEISNVVDDPYYMDLDYEAANAALKAATDAKKKKPAAAAKPKEPELTAEQIQNAKDNADSVGGEIVWQEGDYALIRGYSALTGDPVYVASKGAGYARRDIEQFTGDAIPPDVRQKMIEVKKKAEADAAKKHETDPFIKFVDGVAVSESISPEVEGVIREWKKILKLDVPIYIGTTEDAAANRNNYTGPHRRIGSGTLDANDRGSARRMSDDSYYVLFKSTTSPTLMLETLAHELGHIHEKLVYEKASQEDKDALRDAHAKWLEKQKGKTAQDLVNALRGRAAQRKVKGAEGLTADQMTSYWKSFSEWYADQTARWSVSGKVPVTAVEKFFKRLGNQLRRFYQQLTNAKYLPDETFVQYIERVTEKPADIAPPDAVAVKTTVDDEGSGIGAAVMGQRLINAADRFRKAAMSQHKLTQEQADAAMGRLMQIKVLNLDSVTGQFELRDGRFWNRDVLLRAAEEGDKSSAMLENIEPDATSGRAGWTEKRVDSLIQTYGYADGKTFGIAAFVDPQFFLEATTASVAGIREIRTEAGKLDLQKLASETQTPYLKINIGADGAWEIVGHEGRHRAAALQKEGIRQMPVVLNILKGGFKYPAKFDVAPSQELLGQTFGKARGEDVEVSNLIPINQQNKELLNEEFGGGQILYNIEPPKKLPPGRSPELAAAAQRLQKGEITAAEFDELVNKYKPIPVYFAPLKPATSAEVYNALDSAKREKIDPKIAAGAPVGLRLDIPAFNRHGVFVVSIHEKRTASAPGKVIGYSSVASIKNVTFGVGNQKEALKIAAGAAKDAIQTMEGQYVPLTTEQAYEIADDAILSGDWVQVGFDPTRHAYFFDRSTTQPIVAADEVVQIGNMILAKGVKYAPKSSFLYSIDQGGLFGKQDAGAWTGEKPAAVKRGRSPELTEAAERLRRGEITKAEYDEAVRQFSPVSAYAEPPTPPSDQQVTDALDANKRQYANVDVPTGTRVGLRLDIPAYERRNTWVVAIHAPKPTLTSPKAKDVLSYRSVAGLKNVTFGLGDQARSLRIAAGEFKDKLQTMEGEYVDMTPEEAYKRAQELINDPAYIQIGFNPLRHSYFYDRSTMQPVVKADEVLQIGNFILAKGVTYGRKEDFLYNAPDEDAALKAEIAKEQIAETRAKKIKEYAELRAKIARITAKVAKGEIDLDMQQNLARTMQATRELQAAIRDTTPRADTAEDFLSKALIEYKAKNISYDVLEVIQDVYNKYPELLSGIVLRVRKSRGRAAGAFDPFERVVLLYKGSSGIENPETIRHELTHSLEQMMSDKQRAAVVQAWSKALQRAIKQNPDEMHQKYFQAILDFFDNPSEQKFAAAVAAMPGYAMYQYISPSEFWAVNAEPLLASQLGGAWDKFKRFVKGLLEGLKNIIGFDNRYAIHKTFSQIMGGSKERLNKSTLAQYVQSMGGDFTTLNNIEDDKKLMEKYNRPNTPMLDTSPILTFLTRQFKNGKEFFKDAVNNPREAMVGSANTVMDGLIYARNKNVWYGSGLEARDFAAYNGDLRTSEGLATASVALDNAIRSGNIGVEVIFRGGIKFDADSGTFIGVKTEQGMRGVYEAEAELKKQLGDQLATNVIQGYLEAKRSISINDEFLNRQAAYETAAETYRVLKEIGADPADIAEAEAAKDQLAQELDSIKKAMSSVNMSEEERAEFAALEDKHPELRKIMDNWTAINQNLLRFWRQVGLLSQGRYETLSAIKDYVPWYRIMNDELDLHDSDQSAVQSTTRSMTNIGREKLFKRGRPVAVVDFRAKEGQQEFKIQPSSVVQVEVNGKKVSKDLVTATPDGTVRIDLPLVENDLVVFKTNREIQNIIDNMTRNVMRMTMNGIRQYAANRIVLEYASRNEKNKIMVFPSVDKEKGRFNWMVNGKKVVVEIQDPLVAASIYGMENLNLQMWRPLAAVANLTRRTITLSGVFQIKQVFKDAPTAALVTGVKNPAALIGGAWKGFLTSLTNTDPVVDILKAAGIGGYMSPARTPEAEIKRRLGIMNYNVFSAVIKGLDHIGDASDMAQRVATYKRVLAETGNKTQALYQAANVINFLHHGSAGYAQAVVKTVPFFGAYMNATDVLVRALTGGGLKGVSRKKALLRLGITTSMLVSLSILYAMLAGSDPEYDELDDQTKLKNIIIPGTKIMLPMNTSAAYFFKAIPELIYNAVTREGTENEMDRRRIRNALGDAARDMLLGPEPIPAGFKPLFEVAINHDFFSGRPVIPEGLKDVEAAEQYTAATSELGKKLSAALAIPGTDGKRVLSPIQADHIVRGVFGTSGAMAQWFTNSIGAMAETRPEPTAKETPITGSFLREEVPRGREDLFYDFKEGVSKKYETWKKMMDREDYDAADAYLDKHGDVVGMYEYINEAETDLKEINTEIRRLGETRSKDMTPKERRQEIEEFKRLKQDVLEPVKELRREVFK